MPGLLPILIAGGGIGGVAAALALAKIGVPVEVVERSVAFTAVGAGIQLGPNAVKILRQINIADAVEPFASAPAVLALFSGARDKPIARMPLGADIAQRCGAPYWTIHRADLHRVLTDAANRTPTVTLSYGREVIAVDQRGTQEIVVTFADGGQTRAAGLIGGDGLWSRVREIVAPGVEPAASGYTAYRAVIDADAAGDIDTAIVGACLSRRAHVIHYPVHSGRSINMVVVVSAQSTAAEWTASANPDDVIAATQGFSAPLRRAIAAAPGWHQWALPQPIALASWHAGRVALLGDAAHAMLPFFAQGGAMALEDAVELAAAVSRHGHDLPQAFASYHAARRQRVKRVQDASVENGRIFHLSGLMATGRDAVIGMIPGDAMLGRYDWLYGYDGPKI